MSGSFDGAIALPWMAATAVVGWSAWTVGRRLFPADGPVACAGHAIAVGWAVVVATGLLLGGLGLLTPSAYMIAAAGVAAGLAAFARRAASDQTSASVDPAGWVRFWVCAGAFAVGHTVTGGVLLFPNDWDTLMYHLPLVDHWLQAGSLYAPDGLRWSDPGNNELVALWLVGPFSGDFLYAFNNLFATALLACGTLEVGRRVGLADVTRHLTAATVVSNAVVLKQLIDAENDVASAGAFVAGFGYLLRYAEGRGTPSRALAAACVGVLAGVKFYAVGYAAVVATLLVGFAAARGGRRTAAAATAALGVAIAGLAGYWYVRNWVAGGSPVYPMFAPRAADDLGGWYPDVWRTTLLFNGSEELPALAGRAIWDLCGPCQLLAVTALPLSIGWLLGSGLVRRNGGDARVLLALGTVAAGVVWTVTPFAVEDRPGTLNQLHWKYCPVRYGLCFLSLAVVCLAALGQAAADGVVAFPRGPRVAGVVRAAFEAGWAAALAYQVYCCEQDSRFDPVDAALVGGCILSFVALVYNMATVSVRRRRLGLALLLLATGGVAGIAIAQLSASWHRGYAKFYDRLMGGALISRIAATQPPGQGICVLDHRAYPFFGSARQFRVSQPHGTRAFRWWQDYFRDRGIGLVVARYDHDARSRGWDQTADWFRQNPHVLTPWEPLRAPYTAFRVGSDY